MEYITLTPNGVGIVTLHVIRTSQTREYKCTAILGGSISALISIRVQSKLYYRRYNEGHHHAEFFCFPFTYSYFSLSPSVPQPDVAVTVSNTGTLYVGTGLTLTCTVTLDSSVDNSEHVWSRMPGGGVHCLSCYESD